MPNTEMPGEFELIKRYLAPLSANEPGAYSLTDDAAVVSPLAGHDVVITMDTLVSGIHFLADTTPENIAAKVFRVNMSDLAAMGARPAFYTLSLALPKNAGDDSDPVIDRVWLERFAETLGIEQTIYGVSIIGGDTVSTPGPLTVTITAFGYVKTGKAIRRSMAVPGDLVVISGTIGDAAFGLSALKGNLTALSNSSREIVIERHHRPLPRIELGLRLQNIASAAIDVSDGLIQDLGHICAASGVTAVVELEKVPVSVAVGEAIELTQGTKEDILIGGDDYELLFTVASSRQAELQQISKEIGVDLTIIGQIGLKSPLTDAHNSVPITGGVCVINGNDVPVNTTFTGFRHF